MSDRPDWFAPKRYGYGAGMPISWQGWAITLVFIGVALAAAALLGKHRLLLLSVIVPAMFGLMIVMARTTRGGWRWRWGEDD